MTKSLIRTTGKLIAPQLDYILLDGSGSMKSKWWNTLASIDAYMDILRDANLNAHCILSVFDSHDIQCIQRDEPLSSWTPLSQSPVGAYWGGTPLYDAINMTGRHLKELDPAKCHLIIATDGSENGSTTSQIQAKMILDWCRAKGWQVTFIGCDFNNSKDAALLGGSPQSAIGVAREHMTSAAKALGEKRVRHGRTGAPIHWSEAEQQQFGGYLGSR